MCSMWYNSSKDCTSSKKKMLFTCISVLFFFLVECLCFHFLFLDLYVFYHGLSVFRESDNCFYFLLSFFLFLCFLFLLCLSLRRRELPKFFFVKSVHKRINIKMIYIYIGEHKIKYIIFLCMI